MSHSNIRATKLRGDSSGPLRFCIALIVSALLVSRNLPANVVAATGDLDPAFGKGGKVTTDFGASALATAVAYSAEIIEHGIRGFSPGQRPD